MDTLAQVNEDENDTADVTEPLTGPFGEVIPNLSYDVEIAYGEHDEDSDTHTVTDVTRIEGLDDTKNYAGDRMVRFYRGDGALVFAATRAGIRAVYVAGD